MKQLLEIFTDSLEDNIYASMAFNPLKVTFLVDEDDDLIQKAKYTATRGNKGTSLSARYATPVTEWLF